MRKFNKDYAAAPVKQHPTYRVEQYDDAAQAEIIAEFERRKQEEGITLRSGGDLRREGHAFFQADRDYFLKPLPEKGLVEVSAFNRYDEALLDFDGRIDHECYYDWWYLDERLEPVQGFTQSIVDSLSNRKLFKRKFEAIQEGAAQALRGMPRKPEKVPDPTPGTEPVQETPPPKRTLLDRMKNLFQAETGPKPARLSVETERQGCQTAYVLVGSHGRRTIVDFDKTIQRYPGTENDEAWLKYWKSEKPLENCVSYSVDFTPVGQDAVRMVWMIQPDGRYWADDGGFGMENDLEICLYSTLDVDGEFAHPFRLYSIDQKRVAQDEG